MCHANFVAQIVGDANRSFTSILIQKKIKSNFDQKKSCNLFVCMMDNETPEFAIQDVECGKIKINFDQKKSCNLFVCMMDNETPEFATQDVECGKLGLVNSSCWIDDLCFESLN